MTNDPNGFTKNNRWEEVKLQKPNESYVLWIPNKDEIFKSNNMDLNDPKDSSIIVNHQEYYPENIEISDLKPMEQIKRKVSKFILEQPSYLEDDSLVEMDAAPYSDNGRTFVPVRYLAQAMGIESIQWNGDNRSVTLTMGEKTATMVVGEKIMVTTNEQVMMDVSPQIKGDRIYLPARYVAEVFGYYASWDQDSKTVTIQ